jgi:PAS domain S-box-containing protein
MATIQIVDDNVDNLYVLERILRAHGHTVRAAESGSDALAMAAAEMPDLILLDLMMPNMDGFAVLERLKADSALADIPVIILTASDPDSSLIARALSLGANDYTFKPIDPIELPARVAAALRLHDVASALRRRSDELATALSAVEEARRRAEMQAALAQDRAAHLEAMIASMVEGVFLYDARGELLSINHHGCTLLGLEDWSPKQAPALYPSLLQLSESRAEPSAEPFLVRVLQGETVQDLEVEIELDEPSRPATLLCNGAPIRDGAGEVTGAVLVVSDISERKGLDRAKDEFIGLVAHELKTPLTGLKGHAQLLRRRLERQGGRESDIAGVAAIQEQISRMVTLINDLLEVTRAQMGRLVVDIQPVDIAELARSVAEQMEPNVAMPRITVKAPPTLVWRADQLKLSQVLVNLLGNALHYAASGPITVTAAEAEGELRLTVRDEGLGIASDALERIFARFEQGGAPHGQGLGLGLYISRGIVQAHGGRIWAESEGPGTGATFHVVLPYREIEAAKEQQ